QPQQAARLPQHLAALPAAPGPPHAARAAAGAQRTARDAAVTDEPRERAAVICRALDEAYGRPDLGNHADPVDELIYILLSTMTTEANYQRAFAALRARLPTWEEVLAAPVEAVREAIVDGGLARTKARLIQGVLARLRRGWGGFDLSFMRAWPTTEIRRYLATLPGIGYKAATCVVAYSFGRDVC